MSDYLTGHIKRDPVSSAVAIRTIFPETEAHLIPMAWLVATTGTGARNATTVEVEGWDDLYTPPGLADG